MKYDERIIIGVGTLLLVVLWLGFLRHQSPEFAGSLTGGLFAVAGSVLMLLSSAYSLFKRIPALRNLLSAKKSMRRLLQLHIYMGLAGAILVLIHTGHKFQSMLGILLTGTLLLVVFSGLVGRYFRGFFAEDIQERRNHLEALRTEFQLRAGQLDNSSASLFSTEIAESVDSPDLLALVESIADLEYSLNAEQHLRKAFARCLYIHIVLSGLFYLLLGLHIWAALIYGLRWFQ